MNRKILPLIPAAGGTAAGLYALTNGQPIVTIGIAIATVILTFSAVGNNNKLPSVGAIGIIGLVGTVLGVFTGAYSVAVILAIVTVILAFTLSGPNTPANRNTAAI